MFSIRNEFTWKKIHDFSMKPKKMIILAMDNGSVLFFQYEGEAHI